MITELKVGDYIEKSELDTEQKYNDVVEVFKQWGFTGYDKANDYCSAINDDFPAIYIKDNRFMLCYHNAEIQRRLTYKQVMSLKKTDVDNLNIDKVVSNESAESNSELLKLHAAADGLIRLGYVWDEEERAWCKIVKEYL